MSQPIGAERRSTFRRLLALPLLLIANGLAALSFSASLASPETMAATVVGSWLGVLLGTLLGLSRLRFAWIAAGLALGGGAIAVLTNYWLGSELWVSAVGPGLSLQVTSWCRFGALAFSVSGLLRATSVRRPSWAGLELFVLAFALVAAFASHREGVIARPLWLSDWAWQAGVDPARVFLFLGLLVVALLGTSLLVEGGRGRVISSLVFLLLLGVFGTVGISVVGPPQTPPLSDLDLTDQGEGKTTPPSPDAGTPSGTEQPLDGGGQDEADAGGAQPEFSDGGSSRGDAAFEGGSTDPSDGGAGEGGADSSDSGDSGGKSNSNSPPPEQPNDDSAPTSVPTPVAIVILENDYSPPSEVYFFRQQVLSQFTGTRLVKTSRADADGDVLEEFPVAPTAIRSPVSSWGRKSVRAKVALLIEHPQPFGLESPTLFAPIPNPNPTRFVRAYRFESLAQSVDYREFVGRKVGDPRWSAELREYYLRAPEDPRYAALAKKILETLPKAHRSDPFARALAVKSYLDHALTYSTRERHAGAHDPVADMLFGNHTGYCVHFAHAAVYLWRILGIPSRVGAGYLSEESNRRGGSAILLRASDSHAWPELYIEGMGFLVLDINAERSLDQSRTPPDQELQQMLGEMAREEPPTPSNPGTPVRGQWVRPLAWLSLAVVMAALGAFLIAAYTVKLWRRTAPLWASKRTLPRLAYRAAVDRLAEVGLIREEGETREDFALRVADCCPSLVPLTAHHLAARFRDPALPLPQRPEFDSVELLRLLRQVKAELRAHTRRPRRWVGLLHPLSFLQTH